MHHHLTLLEHTVRYIITMSNHSFMLELLYHPIPLHHIVTTSWLHFHGDKSVTPRRNMPSVMFNVLLNRSVSPLVHFVIPCMSYSYSVSSHFPGCILLVRFCTSIMPLLCFTGMLFQESRQLWEDGLLHYVYNWWNWMDSTLIALYLAYYTLQILVFYKVNSHKTQQII